MTSVTGMLPPARILVVDDEPLTARTLERMVRHFGHDAVVAESLDQAVARFSESAFDVVLSDMNLGRWNGFDLLHHVRERAPDVPVVIITGYATIDSAMEAIQAGAYDYIAKPPTLEALGSLLQRAVEKRRTADSLPPVREKRADADGFDNIVGRSAQMLEVYKTVARAAPGRSSVMILGESGTGKELVARALHRRSPRFERRFVPVNVSAIPEGLLESELFGHVRGAFTGAVTSRRGLFVEAHDGTLFLDEIGDLSLPLQAKLLRAIQEHRIKPVGGNDELEIDVRLVVATHQNLEEMLRAGRFREDLYYRLNVVTLSLPALRERPDDIPILVSHFLEKYARLSGRPPMRFSPEADRVLRDYAWPGNVRELENVIERAVLLATHSPIPVESLPPRLLRDTPLSLPESGTGMPMLREVIDRYVGQVLEFAKGNRTRAARILGISRRTLHRMARRRDENGTGG